MTVTLAVTEPASDLTVTVSPSEPPSGWYSESPTVAATSSAALVEVRVDGGPWEEYTAPVTTIGDGPHTVGFRDSLGGQEEVAFSVDGTAPDISASVDPAVGPEGWWTSAVTVTFTCDDVTSGVATCPDPVVVEADGADQTVTGAAIDVAGNSTSTSITLDVDTGRPTVSALTATPKTVPVGGTLSISADGADLTSGVVAAEVFIGSDPGVGAATAASVDPTTGVISADLVAPDETGSTTIGVRALDAAGWWSETATTTVIVTEGGGDDPEPTVVFSRNRLRLFPAPLDGARVKGKIYVFLDTDGLTEIESVTFELVPARGRRTITHVERAAPYDLLGARWWKAPVPLDVRGRYVGSNSLTVTIERTDGSTIVQELAFTGVPIRHHHRQ